MDPEITAFLISREIQRKFLPLSLLSIRFLHGLSSLHLENPPVPVQPRFLLFYGKSGVCISKTHLCRLDPEITALLISREIQRKFLPVSLLLIGFPPRAQQFASRKPTCAGPTQILLFYYFTILLFYYFTILLFYYFTNFTANQEFASRKPNLACRTRTLLSRENSSLSLYF